MYWIETKLFQYADRICKDFDDYIILDHVASEN